MTLQIPATFDRDNIPAMAFLKVLPAEQRGVFHSLMDALKAARDVVFRVGGRALDDAQVAQMACEHVDVLQRVLPELEFTRFILRDEDGALYSPHLVERQIRREERAAARAEKQRRLDEFQERQDAGEFAPEASVKVMTSRANAAKGGRPRKGETSEQARERREREAVEQREMRLLSSISGGAVSETENQNQFSKTVLVSGVSVSKPVSGFPVDLEVEKDISPSDSNSTKPAETETGKPALEISEALISQTVARVLKIGRLPDGQAGFAKSICGRFLRDGIPADVLVEAVKQHTEKMALNGDTAYKMGAFRKPIERFWADHQAGVSTTPVPEPTPREDWEDRALEAYAKAQKIWSEAFHLQRDYSAVKREWPELAKKHDLPACPVERAAYLDWYRPQAQAA
ncbi:hypothetical protein Gbth_044_011 [Gluconobacter thailandicus F149-1 = NBRC 100600]|uniref:Phage protein n=1 Tax=Gluconobacter thailandicus NBRC 3257 TaxID=1381097 RepID=A0ABQ0IY74_GLUTH|nr:hypothetical protein [Gluconobacter thailandicus]KXV53645.1 hypothetical protein AD946_07120 [Gluconobacter thailandicus]GAC88548.1 hypothetical protein NBRC3255_2209 [Gluconobacter thailandicus NBRC 3255]GAD27164.1 hypothetical protein NBRC3257_2163 [Gluconobacter thailandicus NBRC 3257]GAN94054.1 hypothetical protein Gbth_044_011 [Gluconobacter thailandicus F149-1 = NBRC 100600]GBR58166.1 hypothetical protein AA100600_0645 [Gluconobacter thailandicus F149-1 = NBRC 100600]